MKEFKAESKRLLELMIHSVYTHREIFLRELISNASDATDKRYFRQVQEGGEALNRDDLPITISVDKENRQLIIEDNGIGMTQQELEENLGTIAHSGSFNFKEQLKDNKDDNDVDIIGQFGVGFYSAFMVAEHVTVETKPVDGKAHLWESSGVEGYKISSSDKAEVGTKITLTMLEDTEDEDYSQFLDSYYLQSLVRKYSDYIRYPIKMEVEKSRPIESDDEDAPLEYESYTEMETLNTMVPIWKRQKSDVTDEDYNNFYKEKFYDYSDPLKVIYTSTEGMATYNALLFIPSKMPMNYYSKDYQRGLQLYASGVMIMETCEDLLPEYFAFVRGIVDSQDLSLNISREMLQHDNQLKLIATRLEKRIKSELENLLKNDRENYEKFFENFGLSLKYGIYESYGAQQENLQDLLLFNSSIGEMTTLKEYIDRMPESQEYIYFASGESISQLKNLPAAEAVREKGYEILYFTDQIDEFVMRVMTAYDEKEFRSIATGDLGIESEAEKEEIEKQTEESADMLGKIKELLDGEVEEVALSTRLKSHPVCLTAKGDITLEMEKTLNSMQMPGTPSIKAERVLEINPDHPVFEKLNQLFKDKDDEKLKTYAELLYNQSLLLEGLSIEDPVGFANAINKLMS